MENGSFTFKRQLISARVHERRRWRGRRRRWRRRSGWDGMEREKRRAGEWETGQARERGEMRVMRESVENGKPRQTGERGTDLLRKGQQTLLRTDWP
jgi:hypothetical protein